MTWSKTDHRGLVVILCWGKLDEMRSGFSHYIIDHTPATLCLFRVGNVAEIFTLYKDKGSTVDSAHLWFDFVDFSLDIVTISCT